MINECLGLLKYGDLNGLSANMKCQQDSDYDYEDLAVPQDNIIYLSFTCHALRHNWKENAYKCIKEFSKLYLYRFRR